MVLYNNNILYLPTNHRGNYGDAFQGMVGTVGTPFTRTVLRILTCKQVLYLAFVRTVPEISSPINSNQYECQNLSMYLHLFGGSILAYYFSSTEE